jgi:hypothetical protein
MKKFTIDDLKKAAKSMRENEKIDTTLYFYPHQIEQMQKEGAVFDFDKMRIYGFKFDYWADINTLING